MTLHRFVKQPTDPMAPISLGAEWQGQGFPVSQEMELRLGIIRDEMEFVQSVEDVAKLTTILGEGIHSGFIRGVQLTIDGPTVKLQLGLTSPPWSACYVTALR